MNVKDIPRAAVALFHVLQMSEWNVHWPPRSLDCPDLMVCDFFLWGYLTSRVHGSKLRTLDNLKDTIRVGILIINEQLI